VHHDPPAHARGQWHAHLVDAQRERVAVPGEAAWPDDERVGGAFQRAPAALGERPAFAPRAVQGDVQRAVVERIGPPTPPRPRVIRREDAAEERDDREAVRAVVAQRV
jgi:hypothetical protein